MSTSTTPLVPTTTITESDVETATRAADAFTRMFYSTYDSDTRLSDLPQFYRANSSITWNGKPFQGPDGLRLLIENMPPTKHDVHSFDCHPIPGHQPAHLLLTVSGNVTHGKGPAGNPPNTVYKDVEGQPRVFSETFLLIPDSEPSPNPGDPAKYYVGADALRFVG